MASIKMFEGNVVLENTYVEIKLSAADGLVTEITDKTGKKSILGEKTPFFKFFSKDEKSLSVKSVTLDGDILCLDTEGGAVRVRVTVGDYFSFELIDGLEGDIWSAVIGCANYTYDYTDKNNTGANGIAMTCSVNPNYYPDAKSLKTGGSVFRSLESKGAKYAVVIAPICKMQGLIQSLMEDIDTNMGIVSKAGGPWGIDYPLNYCSYSIQTDVSPKWMKEDYETLVEWTGADEFRFHQGFGTFRQGDFKYYHFKDNADFKAQVSDVMAKNGHFPGLHSYSFYIAYDCDTILSDPEKQKQLCILKTYTLKEDISLDSDFVPTEESTSDISPSLRSRQTPFVLIGEELIKFKKAEGGFKVEERGCAGTKAASHKKGEVVKHVHGHYGCIAPEIGSPLFYEIAKNLAVAVNEGGYKSIYFDALDGIRFHNGATWYWCAKFLCEVLKHLDHTTLFEYSWILPSVWAARGRFGAYDVSAKAYKEMNRRHAAANYEFLDRFGTGTLGWYGFYPQDLTAPGDTNERYHHTDDVDLVGTLAVTHDYGNVYHLKSWYFKENAGFRRNVSLYKKYDTVRKMHYFSKETLEKVRTSPFEHKLIEKRGGKYAFREMDYQVQRLYDIKDDLYKTTYWKNPFGAQTPTVRIQPLLSTEGKDPLTLLPLDENRDLTTQNLKFTFPQTLDLSTRIAKKVRIKGNGKKGGAVCIKVRGNGYIEHFIDTDFEGWREYILVEADNGTRCRDLDFDERDSHFHAVSRVGFFFRSVSGIEVQTQGDMTGVQMSSIVACEHQYDVFRNPSVTIGDTNVTFQCEVASTEFIEWDGKEAKVVDRYANEKKIYFYTTSSMLRAPRGKFKVDFSAKSLNNHTHPRAQLTFAFSGKEIK